MRSDLPESLVDAMQAEDAGLPRLTLLAMLRRAVTLAPTAAVPALAGRIVDVLHDLGGDSLEPLSWLAGELAEMVDAASELQGETDDKGRPRGGELAGLSRQLTVVLRELDQLSVPEEASVPDQLAARRSARIAAAKAS